MRNTIKRISFCLLFIVFSLTTLVLTGCDAKDTLLFLNWGEYINDDVVVAFEEKYNCSVIVDIADSNELFYSKIKSGTTAYDLVCPSDYMVEKMVAHDLLQTIDTSKLTNYDINNFMPGVIGIIDEMNKTTTEANYYDYVMPYLWGTFGLMYNKNKTGLEEAVQKYGWEAYFNDNLLPEGTKIGMYDTPLFAYAAGSFLKNTYGPTIESDDAFNEVEEVLMSRTYKEWGTDTLKKGIAAGNLDLAFVYTGDCLDMLYQKFADGVSVEDVAFDIYVPDNTIAFMDSLVMPKKARHKDLAYKFIDFLLETENAKLNSSVVGYCTALRSSYDLIVNSTLEDEQDWAYAVKTYYPLPKDGEKSFKGIPLTNFSKSYLTKISNMITDVKTTRKQS